MLCKVYSFELNSQETVHQEYFVYCLSRLKQNLHERNLKIKNQERKCSLTTVFGVIDRQQIVICNLFYNIITKTRKLR